MYVCIAYIHSAKGSDYIVHEYSTAGSSFLYLITQ
jgi:hypothetical protein